MQLSDFDYDLPEDLIAKYPLANRSASRLLCLDGETGKTAHRYFTDLIELISPGDCLIFNNSRVIPARLFGNKESGGKIEILIERMLDPHRVLAHVRASKSPRPGSFLLLAQGVRFEVLGRQDELFELRCHDERPVLDVIEDIGQLPLPPYFHRTPEAADLERYQTIYAEPKGSVAAPTAGLHFDDDLWKKLQQKNVEMGFVTLHVGSGTFAPVRVENISDHKMHKEYIEVSQELCDLIHKTKARNGRVIAVGTTTARSLETASKSGELKPFYGDTDIFIHPGYSFRCVDVLITNFHLPHSTLLMLVSAFAGYEQIKSAYQEAIEKKYRFYSYGDAMWLEKFMSIS